MREKDLELPEGPRKAPRCLGVRGLFLRDPGGPPGLLKPSRDGRVDGQAYS